MVSSWNASQPRFPMLGLSRNSSEVSAPFSFLILSHLHITLCLPEFRGYTDITVMTDEDGVEEKYQPTKSNLVRHFLQPRPKPAHPNNSFFQKREIKTLGRGVQPGDHRVFYCMDLPSWHSILPVLISSPTISFWSLGPDAL